MPREYYTYIDPYKKISEKVDDPQNLVPHTRPLTDLIILYMRDALILTEDQNIPKEARKNGERRFYTWKEGLQKWQKNSLNKLVEESSLIIGQSQDFYIWESIAYAGIIWKLETAQKTIEEYAQQVWRTLSQFRVLGGRSAWDDNDECLPGELSVFEWVSVPEEIQSKIELLRVNERSWR